MAPINLLARRCIAPAAPVLAACFVIAGCGGSSPARTFPGGVKPIGSANLGVNLTGLMATNQLYLKHVKMDCPSGPITHFPVNCRFTAIQVALPPGATKKNKKSFPGPYQVAGTITVLGVYFRTRTYEYALNYAPVH